MNIILRHLLTVERNILVTFVERSILATFVDGLEEDPLNIFLSV